MKHKPFEEWIFSDDEISLAGRKAFYDHLRDCNSCYVLDKTWRRVETLIQETGPAAPVEGFSDRWLSRLESDQRKSAERQTVAMLAITSLSAWVFLILFGFQILTRLPEMLAPVLGALAWVGQTLLFARTFIYELVHHAGFLQPALPVFATMGFFAVIGATAILWLKMFRTLARVQGYHQWA